jgi:hypothetical protein
VVGAGDGWSSGAYSTFGILILPFFGAAVANRRRLRGIVYDLIAFVPMLVIITLFCKAMPMNVLVIFAKRSRSAACGSYCGRLGNLGPSGNWQPTYDGTSAPNLMRNL